MLRTQSRGVSRGRIERLMSRHGGTAEGWLYLAAVMDLFSRKIVGWAMRDHMQVELASAATMAIQQERPQAGLIHHSDRGVQGGFNRSSQHFVYRSFVAIRREFPRVFSSQGFCEAWY